MRKATITTQERAARFYRYCHMRLRDETDMVYRNYDLLYPHNEGLSDQPFRVKARSAGLYWPLGEEYEVLQTVQQHLVPQHGLIDTSTIKKLINEYYIYNKIRWRGMRWRTRDPEVSERLYRHYLGRIAKLSDEPYDQQHGQDDV